VETEERKPIRLNRSQRRSLGIKRKFTGRMGRSAWTPKRKGKS